MESLENFYSDALNELENQGLRRELRAVKKLNAREIEKDGRICLNFSGNDYLGLSLDPRLIATSQDWAGRYGAGSSASRLVSGNLDVFTALEEKVAKFKGKEEALILASGFQTNASLLPALFDRTVLKAEPLVFADKLNHASMHLGCQAAGVRQLRYRHLDYAHLEELLQKHCDGRPAFILSETVFSMDGDVVDVAKLVTLARQYNAMLVLDEAHATGVLGTGGAGLAYGHDVDIVMGTFSKAMGGFGAYVACSAVMKDYLVHRCGGLIYSTALPPAVLGAMDAVLDVVPELNDARAHVADLAAQFRAFLTETGLEFGGSETQIVPIYMGEVDEAVRLANSLFENNILAVPIRPPTVPKGQSRVRVSFSAAHTQDDLQKLQTAVKEALS